MRLLNTKSLESEEVTFADVCKAPPLDPQSQTRKKNGFPKVQNACELALENGYDWIWIDSCCIDKSSSAELQEDINSMWRYYANSNVCYVYMADVPNSETGWSSIFAESEWFTRGWTLQELIAPVHVEFYASNWDPIGTKFERYQSIAEIASINERALVHYESMDLFTVAERMSWAAHRKVTKEEDMAYSLLGLLDINLPLLYGEGGKKAFVRIQEAVYNATADHSLFLFRKSSYVGSQPLLAHSPACFCPKGDCTSCLPHGTLMLPPNVHYTNIVASKRWSTQAHEQIMVTFTQFRNEMSTVLPLLEFRDIWSRFKHFDNAKSRAGVTHAAVLNHTLTEYRRGALCLLFQTFPGQDGCNRLEALPTILPNLDDLLSKCQTTKLLVCPRPPQSEKSSQVITFFTLQSDTFFVERWDAESNTSQIVCSKQGWENDSFEIRTKRSAQSSSWEHPVRLFCRLSGLRGTNRLLAVLLVRMHSAWSIKEVYTRKQGLRELRDSSLFSSPVLADRCWIQLPGEERVYIKLRRLPGSANIPQDNALQIRYQLSLE